MVHGLVLKSALCCVRANVRYSTEVAQSPLTSGRQWTLDTVCKCSLSGSLVSTELSGDTPAIIAAATVSRSRHGGSCQGIGKIHNTFWEVSKRISWNTKSILLYSQPSACLLAATLSSDKIEDPYKNFSLSSEYTEY